MKILTAAGNGLSNFKTQIRGSYQLLLAGFSIKHLGANDEVISTF